MVSIPPPFNYSWKMPTFGSPAAATSANQTSSTPSTIAPVNPLVAGAATYYWVCLRRPANPFAPVSLDEPDGRGRLDAVPLHRRHRERRQFLDSAQYQPAPSTTNPVIVLATSGGGTTTANTIYSAQRLQPYRGGHAVPMPNAPGTINPTTLATVSTMPPDPRYGYTEQTAAPSPADYTRSGTNGTYGQSNTGTGTTPGAHTRRPTSSITRWDTTTTRPRTGITWSSTTATSPAWPS